jgi:hypothetical protein
MRHRHSWRASGSPPHGRSRPARRREVRTILWVSSEAKPDPLIDGFRHGMRARGYQ